MGPSIFGGDLAPKASPDYCAWCPTRVRARPDSSNGGGAVCDGAVSSFGEHVSMVKVTYECDSSKESQ